MNDDTKILVIPIETMSKKTKKVVIEKPRKQRIVTQTAKWSDISGNLIEKEESGLRNLLDTGEDEGGIKIEKYTEEPWNIIESYFQGKHLERLVRHQIESYNDFVNYQIQKTINMFNNINSLL